VSEWDCTLEKDGLRGQSCKYSGVEIMDSQPAARRNTCSSDPLLRLGLRLIGGLAEAGAARIVAARRARAFTSIADLAHRARLDARDLTALADADALASLAGHRHEAVWDVAGVERLPAILADSEFDEAQPVLPPPTEGQDIVADYRRLGLTLRRHPLALLRRQLHERRLTTADDIRRAPRGRLVRTAGIVIGRQRPDTASGVVFVTLEDETGATNVIVRRDVGDRQRRELLGARLLGVYGRIEREGSVVHVLAGRLVDLTPMLGALPTRSRDFH
jgi:error-prone DNA polymerase